MSTSLTSLLAVKANTRAVLAAALIERNAECEALRMQLSVAAINTVAHPAPAPHRAINTVARTLPAHMVAARELAMRTGRSVKVVV